MSSLGYVLAAVFLPLFPFSMLFNQLLARLANARLRMILLLLWPQLGVLALLRLGEGPPTWMVWWAVATAILYALRSVVLRDLGLWTGYMATSAWSLLWPAAGFAASSEGGDALALHAVALSLPFVLLAWLTDRLESEFGAAYAGVCGGLAETLPRLSGLLVLAVLAAVATPVVPGFFTLLSITIHALPVMPGAVVLILTVWLLWAWSGVRILRGFIVGPACAEPRRDLGATAVGLFVLAFVVLVLAGISFSGELV
jgi:NADH:ubiquinone oxidoreductase subunit 4 (subunit M)